MLAFEVIAHTPPWVWVLLAFLVYRGIVALQPRISAPQRLLIMPLVFLIWGLTGLFGQAAANLPIAVATFVLGIGAGAGTGRVVAMMRPAPVFDPATRLLHLPGSPAPLILAVVGFTAKYLTSVAMALNPELRAQTFFNAFLGLEGGVLAGIFWGLAAYQFARALEGAGVTPSLNNIVRLAALGAPEPARAP
jgi:hypothetical protein